MNIQISIKSAPNAGATVTLLFPTESLLAGL